MIEAGLEMPNPYSQCFLAGSLIEGIFQILEYKFTMMVGGLGGRKHV
jgi:hypothetical protein